MTLKNLADSGLIAYNWNPKSRSSEFNINGVMRVTCEKRQSATSGEEESTASQVGTTDESRTIPETGTAPQKETYKAIERNAIAIYGAFS